MSLLTSNKRKAFRDKENSERINVIQTVKQELIEDLKRLLEEGSDGDITFIVGKEEFLAHTVILKARAPTFCDQFLPLHLNSSKVEVCIHLQGRLTPDDFRQFLRSVYTHDIAPSYERAEFPWTHEIVCSIPTGLTHESTTETFDSDIVFIDEDSVQVKPQNSSDNEATAAVSTASVEEIQTLSHISSSCTLLNGDCSQDQLNQDQSSQSDKNEVSLASEKNDKLLDELKSYCCCPVGEDLINLIDSEEGSDVVFVIKNRKIRAHRAILSCRSNYFSAMLSGGWLEGTSKEVPIHDLTYDGFMTILCYMYGGIARLPTNLAYICGEVLPLADMYGLTTLRDVICSELRIEKCHLFHKPCAGCITSVLDCLRFSRLFVTFGCTEFKNSCIRWVARNFEVICCNKRFAHLDPNLHDEILSEIRNECRVHSVMHLLKHSDRLTAFTSSVKWAEPTLAFLSALQNFCLAFCVQKFPGLVADGSFKDILKGVGWSTSLIDRIFEAVRSNLCVETSCDQLRAVLWLQHTQDEPGQDWDTSPEFVLVKRLHLQCIDYITSNLHKVRRTEAWKNLSPKTQAELLEGAVIVEDFVDVGAGKAVRIPKPPKLSSASRQTGALVGSQARPTASAGQRGRSATNLAKRGKSQPVANPRTIPSAHKGASSQRAVRPTHKLPAASQVGSGGSKDRGGPSTGDVQNGPSQNENLRSLEERTSDSQARSGRGRAATRDVQNSLQNIALKSLEERPCDVQARSSRGRRLSGDVQDNGSSHNKALRPLEERSRGVQARSGRRRPLTGDARTRGPGLEGSSRGAARNAGTESLEGRTPNPQARSGRRGSQTCGASQNKEKGSLETNTAEDNVGGPSDALGTSGSGKPPSSQSLNKSAAGDSLTTKGSTRTAKAPVQKPTQSATHRYQETLQRRKAMGAQRLAERENLAEQRPSNAKTLSKDTDKQRPGKPSVSARPAWQRPTRNCVSNERQSQEKSLHASISGRPAWQRPTSKASVAFKNSEKQLHEKSLHTASSARPAWQRPSSHVADLTCKNSKKQHVKSSQAPSAVRTVRQKSFLPSLSRTVCDKQKEGGPSTASNAATSSLTVPHCRPLSAPSLLCKDNSERQEEKLSSKLAEPRPRSAPSATSETKENLKRDNPSGHLEGHPTTATNSAAQASCCSHPDSSSNEQNWKAENVQVNESSRQVTLHSTDDLGEASELRGIHQTQASHPRGLGKREAMVRTQAWQSCSSNVTKKVSPPCDEGGSTEAALPTNEAHTTEVSRRPKGITYVIPTPSGAQRNTDIPVISPDKRLSSVDGQAGKDRNVTYIIKTAPESEATKEAVDQVRCSQDGATANSLVTNELQREKDTDAGLVLNYGINETDTFEGRRVLHDVICVEKIAEGKFQAMKRELIGLEGGGVIDSGNESGSSHVQGPRRGTVELPVAHEPANLRSSQPTEDNKKDGTGFPEGIVQTPKVARGDSGASCLDWMPCGNSTPCTSESVARRSLGFKTEQKSLFNDESSDLSFGVDVRIVGCNELEDSNNEES